MSGRSYMNETARSLEMRLKEHKRAVKYVGSNNGTAFHANNTHHDIAWDRADILDWEKTGIRDNIRKPDYQKRGEP